MNFDHGAIEAFRRDGFAIVDELVDGDDLASLRAAYDDLIVEAGRAAGDRLLGGVTRQVMRPSDDHPVFADNAALRRAIVLAEHLVGQPVHLQFDMLIYKPAGHPHETPWHQDASYNDQPFSPPGTEIADGRLQFWIALDDVDAETGCMHFVAGHHRRPLLAHRVAGGEPDDPGRLLALVDPAEQLDLSTVVAAPLAAGGCTIHAYGTPHYTPPNRSANRDRRAYIINVMR